MEIEVSRIFKFDGDGPVKAMCDLIVGGKLVVKGFRIVNGKNGMFVSPPREQGKDGKWYERVSFLSDDDKHSMSETVLKVYEDEK